MSLLKLLILEEPDELLPDQLEPLIRLVKPLDVKKFNTNLVYSQISAHNRRFACALVSGVQELEGTVINFRTKIYVFRIVIS